MSAGIVFYIGAALVFLLAACNTTEDITASEGDGATLGPTPTAITTSVGVVTGTRVDSVAVEPRTTVNGSMPAVVETQLDAMEIVAAREEVLANIYEQSLPSVVYVRVVHRLDPDDNQFGRDFFGGIPPRPP